MRLLKVFQNFVSLSIIECPELTIELLDHLPSLETIVIKKCEKWMVSFSSFPKLTELEIDECKLVVCTSSSTEIMSPKSESLPNIVEPENWLSQNFSCVEKPLKWCHGLTSLKSLVIENCSVSFLNTIFLPNLSHMEIRNCEALKSLPKRLKQNNIESMRISNCDSLLFIARNTLPSSLKSLDISFCKKLQHLEGISSTLLESLFIDDCESLTCLTPRGLLPKTLRSLDVITCPNLTTLSRRWCVHKTLDKLQIYNCPKLKSIEEAFHNSPRLNTIYLWGLPNLEFNRLFGLRNLTGLQELAIRNCSMSLPIEGIPTSLKYLYIAQNVEMSKTLIRWGLHNLTSLTHLEINGFEDPELILSEDQRMPTSLESLRIYNFAPFRSISNLGTLTSLKELTIGNSPNLESIPNLECLVSLKSFSIWSCPKIKSIPDLGGQTSLEEFRIWICPNLKSIACLGSLTSLQILHIGDCPKLKSVPSPPSSLLKLEIDECPLLKKQWRRGKGKYCSKIAHIPYVKIDFKFIFNSKEEKGSDSE